MIGYDIMQGNPLDSSGDHKIDPGFTLPIFDYAADGYIETADKRHLVPAKVKVLGCEGCDLSFQTNVVSTSKLAWHYSSRRPHIITQNSFKSSRG